MGRAAQREQTRQRIVEAAVGVFAELGFEAASTRTIAARAGVTQGLVTYHFPAKDDLWRAAADEIFVGFAPTVPAAVDGDQRQNRRRARRAIREFVVFSASRPEIFHFMVDAGRHDDERMRWLVEAHLAPRFATVMGLVGAGAGGTSLAPHAYYALVGAGSLIFAVGPECRALTGVDPADPATVDRHARLVARMLVPD